MNKWILLITATLITSPAFSGNSPVSDIHVSLTEGDNGSHLLAGGFSIESSTNVVWEVLTDYDHMGDFVSSIKSSRLVRSDGEGFLVEQDMTGKAGIFRKRVHLLLEVKEVPQQQILFRDLSKKSFKSYSGSWELEPDNGSLNIRYKLEANPDFFSPDFLAVNAFKRTVKNLLEEVRDEIQKRDLKNAASKE